MPTDMPMRFLCRLLALSVIFFPFSATAGELNGKGTVTFSVTPVSSTPLASNTRHDEVRLKGVILADDPANPLHLSTQDCAGGSVSDAQGMAIEAAGSCTAVDRDGDMWWLWYHNKGADRTWGVIAGTGKYSGATGSGTTAELAGTADGRLVISWQGTLNLK